MKTTEIIANFMKGYDKVTITEKQRSWLISVAKKEGYKTSNYDQILYLNDCYYNIKNCKILASGGSFVGTKTISGKYNMERLFHIKFTEGQQMTACYGRMDLERFNRENHPFVIINPTTYEPIN